MGGVVKAVGNIVSSVGKAVGKVVSYAGKTIGNVAKGALSNPLGTIAKVAALATGNAWALPLINGAEVVANGGSIGKALLSAGATYAGNFVAGSSFVTGALADAGISGAAANMITGGIRGAVGSGLQGENILEGALGGAAHAGLGGALADSGLGNALNATLGASGGALAGQAITSGLRGGLSAALKGRDIGEGIAGGASSGMFDSFMNNLSGLGSSAKAYFGDMYKAQVEPLYNAQLQLQSDLQNKGTELQNMHGEIVGAYNTYNDAVAETQKYVDSYNAQSAEFNDLKAQYERAVESGNTEEADRLADLANAKASDAEKTYAAYEKASQSLTEAERNATSLAENYEKSKVDLESGVNTYKTNLAKLEEAASPLAQAEEAAKENWYQNLDSDSSSVTPINEQVFDDGSKIQIFDDGSQIITNADGTNTVYQSDGAVFTPTPLKEGEKPAEAPKNQATNWSSLLRNTLGAMGGVAGASGLARSPAGQRPGTAQTGAPSNQSSAFGDMQGKTARPDTLIEGKANYDLGYETDYGKNLGQTKLTAIPGINAPVVKPEEQYLTFGAQAPEQQKDSNQDYLSFVQDETPQVASEATPTYRSGGKVTREDIERGAKMMFMSEGSLTNKHRHVKGAGDGTSDDIPAWLARDEYVVSADVVSALGNGSSDAGAEKLDKFVEAVRTHKRGANPKKLAPDAKNIHQYLPQGAV